MSTTPKELIFAEDARLKLAEGIDILADAVCMTLGPVGRNVGLQSSWGAPKITCDGYTIAKDIEVKDPYINMGISLGKEVAEKIKDQSGDGTTTGIILFRALVKQGVKNIASGASPILLKRGIDKGVTIALEALKELSTPVNDDSILHHIATVSASGNEEIGGMIAHAFSRVGRSGVITIEESKATTTTLEIVEGMQLDRGYASPYFCTDSEQMVCVLHAPKILITDKKLSSIQEILPVLQTVATTSQELLIIAEDIDGDPLSTLVVNKLRGTLKVAFIKAPGFGERRKQLLQDIAVITGGTLISEEVGLELKEAHHEHLGSAEKIIISKEKTTIIGGKGSSESIQSRIAQINGEILHASSEYDKEKLVERKAKLSGGVAVIKVGGATEPEMKQKKQVFQDSLNSTKAALETGFVPGGGVAFLQAAQKLKTVVCKEEEKTGIQLLIKALEAPVHQIISNSSFESPLLIEQILSKPFGFGFNVKTEQVENLLDANVLDPSEVLRSALSIAASSAGVVLLTESLIGPASEELSS